MTRSTSIWTIWEGSGDHPGQYRYMARRYEALPAVVYATDEYILSDSLESLRARLEAKGLALIPRSDGDDPRIIESWI